MDAWDSRGGRAQVRSYGGLRSIVGADLAAMDAWDCRGGRAQVRSYRGPRSIVGADLATSEAQDNHAGLRYFTNILHTVTIGLE